MWKTFSSKALRRKLFNNISYYMTSSNDHTKHDPFEISRNPENEIESFSQWKMSSL